VEPERWARAAREGFTAAADVADVLAAEAGLDYRTAHHVVGRAVRDLVDAGLAPDALTPERVAAAAEASIGRPVAISAEALAAALDPAACAAARRQTGSSAPGEVASMIAAVRAGAAEGRAFSAAARERAERADAALLARARELAGG
jgi:argininosuccinate lyase